MTRLFLPLLFAATASADVIALPSTKAAIDLPRTWAPVETPGVVLGATGPGRELLAITRSAAPNPDAWRGKKRDAYLEELEAGVAARIAGYRRISKKLGEIGTVPTLDLEATRADGATIVLRVLVYRTYALALAIEVPKRVSPRAARAVVKTFTSGT